MALLLLALVSQGDPRLAAKVDVRLKIAPIEEAVAALGKAAGITLTTASAIRDLKVTILVDGTAVGRVMNRVADAMRLQWQPEGDGYRLVSDAAAASREAAFLRAQAEARRRAMETTLRTQAEAAEVSFQEAPEAYRSAQKAAYAMKPGDPKREAAMRRANALGGMMSRDNWLQGRLLRGLGKEGWRRLLAGETLGASTSPGNGGVALPAAALSLPQWQGANGEAPEASRQGRIDLFLRADPETGEIASRSDQTGADGNSRSMSRGSTGEAHGDETALDESPFRREVSAWDEETPKDPALALRCDPRTPERPSVWWTGYLSVADRLEWLHESSGVPVVAMAFRQPSRRSSLRFDGTVGEWIKAARGQSDGGAFRVVDGFLMARPYEFWKRRRTEPPEAAVRRLEAKESPTLDDYAEFVARVSNRQATTAQSTGDFLMRVSPYALSDGLPALRVWAALAPAQRAALRGGGAVAYRVLSGAGQAAYAAAVGDVFGGGWHDGPMAARFSGAAPVSFEGWGILAKTERVQAVGRSRPDPLDRTYSGIYQPNMEPASPGIELMLGPSREDSVRYTLPLAGLPIKR